MTDSVFVDLKQLSKKAAEDFLNSYTGWNQTIAAAAYEKGYQVEIFQAREVLRITHPVNKEQVYMHYMHSSLNTESAATISNDKFTTNALLRDVSIPVANSMTLRVPKKDTQQDLKIENIAYPIVMKPNKNTVGGSGVHMNIPNATELLAAIQDVYAPETEIVIEEQHFYPHEYRVLVLDQKVIAVTERVPAYIVGNGQSTIIERIAEKNQERRSNPKIKMYPIPLDEITEQKVSAAGYTLIDILPDRERLQLQDVVNSGRGGEFYDMTDDICPENIELCVRAADTLNLRFVGFDVLCESISKPIVNGAGIIVEANEYPGITCHIFPHVGKPRLVQYQMLNALFSKK